MLEATRTPEAIATKSPEELADYFSKHPEAEKALKEKLKTLPDEQMRGANNRLADAFPAASDTVPGHGIQLPGLSGEAAQQLSQINETHLKPHAGHSVQLGAAYSKLKITNEYMGDEGAILGAPDPAKGFDEGEKYLPHDMHRPENDGKHHPRYDVREARGSDVQLRASSIKAVAQYYPDAISFDPQSGHALINTHKVGQKRFYVQLAKWSPPDESGIIKLDPTYSEAAGVIIKNRNAELVLQQSQSSQQQQCRAVATDEAINAQARQLQGLNVEAEVRPAFRISAKEERPGEP